MKFQSGMDFDYLSSPLTDDEIEWKVQTCGKNSNGFWCLIVPYIQARAAMDRFDKAFGPLNWKVNYTFMQEGVLCHLSVFDESKKEWVTKEDGAERTDIEPFKGGMSSALKRAAVTYGIGRELYTFDKVFGKIVDKGTKGAQRATTKDREEFFFVPPKLEEISGVKQTTTQNQKPSGNHQARGNPTDASGGVNKDKQQINEARAPEGSGNRKLVESNDTGHKPPKTESEEVTPEERRQLKEVALSTGWSMEWVLGELEKRYSVKNTAQLSRKQFNEFRDLIVNNPQKKDSK